MEVNIQNSSNDNPKINWRSYFSIKNRNIIKSISRRIIKEIWADLLRSNYMIYVFDTLNELDNNERETYAYYLCMYLKIHGFPYNDSEIYNRLDINAPIKANICDEECRKCILNILQNINNSKFNIEDYLNVKLEMRQELFVQGYVCKNYYLNKIEYIPDNDKDIITQEDNIEQEDVIFGFTTDYDFKEKALKEQNININVENLNRLIAETPYKSSNKLLNYSAAIINKFIDYKLSKNYFICHTIIIINNDISIEDIIDERDVNIIIWKKNLILKRPKCKMRLYFNDIGDTNLFSTYMTVKDLIGPNFISKYKNYPILGAVKYAYQEKYGYYVNSIVLNKFDRIKIDNVDQVVNWVSKNFQEFNNMDININNDLEFDDLFGVNVKI